MLKLKIAMTVMLAFVTVFCCACLNDNGENVFVTPNKYNVSVEIVGTGSARVRGDGEHLEGDECHVSVDMDPNCVFDGWLLGEEYVGTGRFFDDETGITGNLNLKAIVNEKYRSQIMVTKKGRGTVTGTAEIPLGISYHTGEYEIGENVTWTATPDIDYTFAGWFVGDVLKSSAATYTFAVPFDDLNLSARFVSIYPETIYELLLVCIGGVGTVQYTTREDETSEVMVISSSPLEPTSIYLPEWAQVTLFTTNTSLRAKFLGWTSDARDSDYGIPEVGSYNTDRQMTFTMPPDPILVTGEWFDYSGWF